MTYQKAMFGELTSAGVLQIGDGYRAKNEELGGTGPVFLRAAYLQDGGFIETNYERFKSLALSQFGPKIAQLNDVVVTTKGNSTGRVGRIRSSQTGSVYSPHLSYWRSTRPDQIDQIFLFYWSKSREFMEQLAGMAGSTDMAPYLSLRDQLRLQITVPPVEDQRQIASVLGALDDKIDLTRGMNETLETMARAVFKEWFVDFGPTRAKMEGRAPYLSPEVWSLFPDWLDDDGKPAGWRTCLLGDLCSRIAIGPFGSDITTDNFVDIGVPVIRGMNLRDGFIDNEFAFLTENKADALRNANAFSGDIVITHRGTLGQVGMIPSPSRFPRYVISQSQMLLSVDQSATTSNYIFEFLRSPIGQERLLANTSQTGVPAIARPTTSLRSIHVVAPSVIVLAEFEAVAKPLAQRTEANDAENRTLSAIRDLLLPKLMSGEVRIKDAEKVVEAVL
jgi:type I restriction enzyme S subunit